MNIRTANWFQIQSSYTEQNGLTVTLRGTPLQLTVEDVCYLLLRVDGHATASREPPLTVGFMLYGVHYAVTNDEWSTFIDALQSAAGKGGWTALSCSKT